VHEDFWKAYNKFLEGNTEEANSEIPTIETELTISYDPVKDTDFGGLSEFIIDLNPKITETRIRLKYALSLKAIDSFFENIDVSDIEDNIQRKSTFFQRIDVLLPKCYALKIEAIDPSNDQNTKEASLKDFRKVFGAGFISAQRGLDDITHKDNDVLGKILGQLFMLAKQDNASKEDQSVVKQLTEQVLKAQDKINSDLNESLDQFFPTLNHFGYPGLEDPTFTTETVLDVEKILEGHTRIRYTEGCSIGLPEAYNGLGMRNLIFLLINLYKYYKVFLNSDITPNVHLIFVEEPEAHLHPQMQEVFIESMSTVSEEISKKYNKDRFWPVQFVVTTHSTHIANRASFDSIRYFLCSKDSAKQTVVKDFRYGFSGDQQEPDRKFLHKYLTLTKCDLFFADRAILIEGASERIMLPKFIKIANTGLEKKYLSVVEVGGAYAHHFYSLLDFLELKTEPDPKKWTAP